MLARIVVDGAELPAAGEVIPAELDRAMTETVALLERETKIRTPIGVTETARGSIAGETRRLTHGDVVGTVGSPVVHVQVLEYGRRPGQKPPPAEALELWVRRKLNVKDIGESRRVAFVVARSIGKKGMEPVAMFEHALMENLDKIERIFDGAGYRVARIMTER